MKYLLALDIGTTAVKGGLFDTQLKVVSAASMEYSLLTPQRDFVELDPEIYWDSAREVIRRILSESGVDKRKIQSLTVTTQGETFIPIDAEGTPLSNAVVWLDGRAKVQAEELKWMFDPAAFYRQTGIPDLNGFCPCAKLRWFRQNTDVLQKAYKILLLEDYLIFKLTGKTVTNPALCCSTGWFDIVSNRYIGEMLDAMGIRESQLPDIQPSGTVVGKILGSVADDVGLNPETRVTTGAMDQISSAIGCGNFENGTVSETTGTCTVIAVSSDTPPSEYSNCAVYSHAIEGTYCKVIVLQCAGILYKWFRDKFCDGMNYDDINALAAEVPPLCNGLLLYPHFTGRQFPVSNENLRGVFWGMGLDTGKGECARAIMEGVGYTMREGIEALSIVPDRLVSIGGGSKSSLWCQIKADILNTQIVTLQNEETTLLGAAILGGVATGIFENIRKTAAGRIAVKDTYRPTDWVDAYRAGYANYRKLDNLFTIAYDGGDHL